MQNTKNPGVGLACAILAYTLWGIFPLYWKMLRSVGVYEIICHRVIWVTFFAGLILFLRGRLKALPAACRQRRTLQTFFLTAALQGSNWTVYVWAVNNGHIVEASLGYFINPLVTVLLGMLFLRERLRTMQWIAVALAATGVLYLTVINGRPPWISLFLAGTFATYALLRKTALLDSLQGLFLETAILTPIALTALFFLAGNGTLAFIHEGLTISLLLIGAGIVTGFPLLIFVFAAKKITMASIGLLQYIAPSLQFIIGIFVFQEPFYLSKLMGFSIIWSALFLYSLEGTLFHLRYRKTLV